LLGILAIGGALAPILPPFLSRPLDTPVQRSSQRRWWHCTTYHSLCYQVLVTQVPGNVCVGLR